MPTYRCPECGFSGKLGELTNHLRNNPSHWHVRCQECGDSLVTKKDFVNHEQKTGHAPVGVDILGYYQCPRNYQGQGYRERSSQKQINSFRIF